MSVFDSLSKQVLGITQNYFGESVTYNYKDISLEASTVKAVFELSEVETNGVSAQAMTCQIVGSDLSAVPSKGDKITQGSKIWSISSAQVDSDGLYTLVLKD
mgnify:CR=1 FL=1